MSVSIIIPARNEGKTISGVVKAAVDFEGFVDIIVVDDGSVDDTACRAKEAGAVVVSMPQNVGKGEAIRKGLEFVSKSVGVILLFDADLIGVERGHFSRIIDPVEANEADMIVGVIPTIGQKMAPWMSGLRAISKHHLTQFFAQMSLEGSNELKFDIEYRLNCWTRDYISNKVLICDVGHGNGDGYRVINNQRIRRVWLPGIKHLSKIQKLGFWRGLWASIIMWIDIIRVWYEKL